MNTALQVLQLVGTFLPVLGLVATFVVAYKMRIGAGKMWVLLIGPAVTLAVCMLFAEFIGANGNMLFVALLLLLWIFLLAYYPILVGVWAMREVRRRRAG